MDADPVVPIEIQCQRVAMVLEFLGKRVGETGDPRNSGEVLYASAKLWTTLCQSLWISNRDTTESSAAFQPCGFLHRFAVNSGDQEESE